jgi:hypothetical protein
MDEPKGDHGNTLNRIELEDNAISLAAYRGAANATEMREVIRRIDAPGQAPAVGRFLD